MDKHLREILGPLASGIRHRYLMLKDRADLKACESIDIGSCESVCLTLGPYRNLTTLTAATLFLHPNCQVLNHAGNRIYGNRHVDFLSNYNRGKLDRFIQFAVKISSKGWRGDDGGSITYSHAFDSAYKMKEVYARMELEMVKDEIKCLVWKESLITSNLIRNKQIDLGAIFEKEERLRFLLPIRNPLDCAKSNLKTGHVDRFRGLDRDSSSADVLKAILQEIHGFASLKREFPDRFFYYLEHSISREMLSDLASFLKLDPVEAWVSNAVEVMVTVSNYEHDTALVDFHREAVMEMFTDFPELSEALLAFTS